MANFDSGRLGALFRQRAQTVSASKETEIADLIEALWAASQPLPSAGTIRQLNDHLSAIGHHLERIDSEAAPLGPALNAPQAVIADQSVLIKLVINRRDDPGPSGKVVLVRPEGGGAP